MAGDLYAVIDRVPDIDPDGLVQKKALTAANLMVHSQLSSRCDLAYQCILKDEEEKEEEEGSGSESERERKYPFQRQPSRFSQFLKPLI